MMDDPLLMYLLAGGVIVTLGWFLVVIPTVVIHYWRKR
jgi:hypothetical protein